MATRLLGIYLNDHLAGATVAVELARRAARANDGTPVGEFLAGALVPELGEDRETVERLMQALDIARSRPKLLAAWTAEKAGRLKLNGELRRYSPLSRLLELEGLAALIELQRGLWLALAESVPTDGFDFGRLAERAVSQRARLEEHRRAAAAVVLRSPHAGSAPPAPSGRAA
jgi:hypothetical protein